MKYEYWLACLKGISQNKKILLRKRVKTAEELYYIEETRMEEFEFLNERNEIQYSRRKSMGIRGSDMKRWSIRGYGLSPGFRKIILNA